MPPHDDALDLQNLTYTTTAATTVTNAATTTTVPYDNTFVTDRLTINADDIYRTYAFPDINLGGAWTASPAKSTRYVTKKDLDNLVRKFYQVMAEHVILDVSEDEFVKLLNEAQDE